MICHPSEFDFYLCSHSGIKVMIGRTNHNFTLQWNWNNFTSSVNSFFFCIWTGDEPSNTLSCSFRWKWVQGWYAANLNLQSLLHVSLLCRFTLRWTVHASSPLFTILTWCNPFFLGWSLACSYARCTRAVSIGMRYLVGFSFIQLSELIFLPVIFLSVVLFFFFYWILLLSYLNSSSSILCASGSLPSTLLHGGRAFWSGLFFLRNDANGSIDEAASWNQGEC